MQRTSTLGTPTLGLERQAGAGATGWRPVRGCSSLLFTSPEDRVDASTGSDWHDKEDCELSDAESLSEDELEATLKYDTVSTFVSTQMGLNMSEEADTGVGR